jgi:signal transduction histidine kinase
MAVLESNRLFAGLDSQELRAVKQAAQERSFAAGEQVFKEGDQGDGVYFVSEGLVQISTVVGESERRVLTRIQPGDFFGEMAVVDNQPRSATATAEEDSQLWFVASAEMLDMMRRCPRIAVNLLREFSHRMREFNRHYVQELLQAERLALVGRFARSIVHDFKNPLNIIGLSAEMAAMDIATPAMRQSAKVRIRKQVDRLSNMINELLEFTRGAQTPAVLAETDYAAFVLPLVEDIRAEVSIKNVVVELQNQPPRVTLLLDPARLTNVFYNLAHNAVDAMMPDGGKIMLRFAVAEGEVVTEMEDTGQGIAPEIAGSLFEAFTTFGKAQGTGLGLSICKRIIQDHGGQIHARSKPGQGAVFAFSLPRR